MNLILILIWIVVISIFSIFGSWYVRKYEKSDALVGMYVAFVLISNILAYKIAVFDFGFITFYATSATIIFAVTYLLADIVNEKFGRKETQKMIFIAFITQIAIVVLIWISINMTPAPFWNDQESFARVLGFAPRIVFAGLVAFIICENVDAYIFSWFKKITKGKHLWMRNALSSIPVMVLDTIVFVTIAFAGVQPLLPLIIGVTILKWIVAIIDIPFMYLNRKIMYKNN